MRSLVFALSLLTAAPAAHAALTDFADETLDDEAGLRAARDELKELQKKINRKDIPAIEFEFDSAKLRPYSKDTLEMVADLLFKYPRFKLFVAGHTCDIGSDEYNLWLSQKRAESVKNYLVSIGVMGEFVRAKGYGEAKPIVPNEDEEGRMKNRRVEFRILTRWWNAIY